MTTQSRWARIAELFDAALELPAAERPAWLASACAGESDVQREVERMLAGHGQADGVLERRLTPRDDTSSIGVEPRFSGNRFQLIREIGRGGMGVVYQARDTRLDRFVALKFLPHADAASREMFIAEARAASSLDHPNICTVYDFGETEDGRLYMAMAYYDGLTLRQRLARGPAAPREALEIAIQIGEGLARAHEAGIVHRDIKASNIIVTADGRVKILDFGIAKLGRGEATALLGGRIGTLYYMSPEQAAGPEVDHRTDLWSLGVVLYELLSGQLPFRGDTVSGIIDGILRKEPPSIREIRPDLPAEVEPPLAKLLAKRLPDRFLSAAAAVSALRAARDKLGFAAAAGSLPAMLTSFVGRERETQQLVSLLGSARLVTLTGPAGAGKTRLAAHAAGLMEREFDGVFFVPLSASDPALVAPAIARALGVAEAPALPLMDALRSALNDRRALLVIDNFEQVTAAADTVAQLLAAASSLRVLVTSRVPLRLSGEHEFPAPPLELPDARSGDDAEALARCSAIALFADRARAVKPGFSLDAGNIRAVAELCARLDGLPLAIELAAARIKVLSPQAILARLANRLDLLKGGPIDRPARHQTLRNAIAWSHDLLGQEERRLFRRLSVFAGGCTLEAAEAVTGCADALDGLFLLVEHSLLRQSEGAEGEPRFSMLETIRAYAAEQLRLAGEETEITRGFAGYLADWAATAEPELTGSNQRLWFDRLEEQHENLRAAMAWARDSGEAEAGLRIGASVWRFWIARGYLLEGRQWLDSLLGAAGAAPVTPFVRARALDGLGTILHYQGDSARARACLEESLAVHRAGSDAGRAAAALNNLAWVSCETGDFADAERLSNEALAIHRASGEKRGQALALNNLGWIACYRGRTAAARSCHEQSLALRKQIGDRRGIAFAMTNLAWADELAGGYARARLLLKEACAALEELDDQLLLIWTSFRFASVALAEGNLTEVRELMERAARVAEKVGNLSLVASVVYMLGLVAYHQGQLARASELFAESLAKWNAAGAAWGVATIHQALGAVESARGNRDEAARLLESALREFERLDCPLGMAECLEQLSGLALERSDRETAARRLDRAAKLRVEAGCPLPPVRRAWRETLARAIASGGAGA